MLNKACEIIVFKPFVGKPTKVIKTIFKNKKSYIDTTTTTT